MIIGSFHGTKWDAGLDPGPCDRFNNCELTIYLRVHLQQVNPAGGAATATVRDAGGSPKLVVRWTGVQWSRWTRRYRRECQRFWDGKFWLLTPRGYGELDYTDLQRYRPNIWCRFNLEVVNSAAGAHHAIRCVRLDPSVPFFRSHSRLYDHLDLDPQMQAHGGIKRTHVHETGHLLGLGHSAQYREECRRTGDNNSPPCYGVTRDEQLDVMGSGSHVNEWHAQPWREAMERCTRMSSYAWGISRRRIYPRTVDEIRRNIWTRRRPQR